MGLRQVTISLLCCNVKRHNLRDYFTSIKGWGTMNTRQVIKHTLFKNNKAHQKNITTNSAHRFLTINQSLVLLRPSLTRSGFSKLLFFRASTMVQGLFHLC